MNGRSELDRFLRTDPRDVGCAQAMEMLHIYAELTAAGAAAEHCSAKGTDRDRLLAACLGRPSSFLPGSPLG